MALTRDDVEQTAQAAHIALTEDELEQLPAQLGGMLDQLAVLRKLEAAGVAPATHGTDAENVLRPDEVQPGLTPAEALANVPGGGDAIRVPRILDSQGGSA